MQETKMQSGQRRLKLPDIVILEQREKKGYSGTAGFYEDRALKKYTDLNRSDTTLRGIQYYPCI
jgi:hypothetical protein